MTEKKDHPKAETPSRALIDDPCEISIKVGENTFNAKGNKADLKEAAIRFMQFALTPDLEKVAEFSRAVADNLRISAGHHEKAAQFLERMDRVVQAAEARGVKVFDDKKPAAKKDAPK